MKPWIWQTTFVTAKYIHNFKMFKTLSVPSTTMYRVSYDAKVIIEHTKCPRVPCLCEIVKVGTHFQLRNISMNHLYWYIWCIEYGILQIDMNHRKRNIQKQWVYNVHSIALIDEENGIYVSRTFKHNDVGHGCWMYCLMCNI